jgi:hypothetical protein
MHLPLHTPDHTVKLSPEEEKAVTAAAAAHDMERDFACTLGRGMSDPTKKDWDLKDPVIRQGASALSTQKKFNFGMQSVFALQQVWFHPPMQGATPPPSHPAGDPASFRHWFQDSGPFFEEFTRQQATELMLASRKARMPLLSGRGLSPPAAPQTTDCDSAFWKALEDDGL